MWNDGWTHGGMMGWADGGWHWLLSFHGLLSAVFLAVIIFALVGIVRDLLRRDSGFAPETTPETRHAIRDTEADEYLETKRHLKA